MTSTSRRLGQAGGKIRLTHHLVELDGGQTVGVSVGGHGVPLVFMHGLALSRRAYLRFLSRIAALGFLVVAVDAAGHGDTHDLPRGACTFNDRVDLTIRALDALGIHRAVFVGHSMGGRMAIQLSAAAPDRVLAVVLFDAAAGISFDTAVSTVLRSPREMLRTFVGAANDIRGDPFRMKFADANRYLRLLATVAMGNARRPAGVTGAARAIMESGDYTPLLHTMRELRIPTVALHGERDLIVPFASALEVAQDADATLYRVPNAIHSWMIANPRHGADSLRQLLGAEIGDALRCTAITLGLHDWRDPSGWDEALIERGAQIRELNRRVREIGLDVGQRVELQLIRRAKSSCDPSCEVFVGGDVSIALGNSLMPVVVADLAGNGCAPPDQPLAQLVVVVGIARQHADHRAI